MKRLKRDGISEPAQPRRGWAFVLSSPSGGGKTTVISHLLQRVPALIRSVSVTTRIPRPGERNGREYHFVSEDRFRQMLRAGQLIEWAKVHGAYYGTPQAEILRAIERGQDIVLTIDVQGARKIRKALGNLAVLVFLKPPSMSHLKSRLLSRQTESPESLKQRMRAAHREMKSAAWYDYVVVNDRLQEAVDQLEAIVRAERARVRR